MALIIGIDLGKYKSVACSYDTDTRATTHATLATEPAAMRRLLESGRPVLVVFKAGTPAGWLADLRRETGLDHLVANTNAPTAP